MPKFTPFRYALPIVAAAAALALLAPAADPPPARKPWTTSRVTGSPEPPPPFRTARVFPNVTLRHPVVLAFAPGSDRFFVGEHHGNIVSIANRPDATAEPFFDLTKDLKTLKQLPGAEAVDAVYGLAFHPKFRENRHCFVCYTLKGGRGVNNLPDGTRVSRFRVTPTDPPRIDPESEEVVFSFLQGGHNGGDVHFGPDGCLYISTGDATNPNPPDRFKTGQDNSDLLSSILRIDVDRTDPGKNHAVPPDNPFVNLPNTRPEIWAYGFRNPWRMSFDRKTGELWVADVGWELWEMVHRVEKGGNYGWSIMEGPQPINTDLPAGPTPIRRGVIELPHTASASITGGYVYRGGKFPELAGAYVFGDHETKRTWAARIDGDRLASLAEITEPRHRISAFGQDHAGEIYICDYDAGTLHTLERNTAANQSAAFPRTLSATGLFASVKDHAPADGVVPFAVHAAQWLDGATAERFVALPGLSQVVWHPRDVQIPGSMFRRRLEFPKDAVLVRTLSAEAQRGNPATRRRVETQILHTDGIYWWGYSYAWNDEQTDAELLAAEGGERVFTVPDPAAPGGKRELTWTYPSRTQCLQCHTPWAQSTLAFSLPQLNRDVDMNGTRVNQLMALEAAGLIQRGGTNNQTPPPLTRESAAKQPTLCDPYDSAADLTLRARSYLHVNCSHCHRFGGGGAVDFEMPFDTPLDKTKVIDARPSRGTFDLPDARVIAPGDPHRSVLYYRLSKFGRDRMPQIGSELPDEAGLAVLHDWIKSLPATEPPAPPTDGNSTDANGALTAAEIDRRLSSPATALALARRVGRHQLSADARAQVLASIAKLPPGPVRDLFDGYLPRTGERKLGTNPRPAAILALKGDADRGAAIFWTKETQCQNCHRIGDKGTALGPDLTAIGKTRTKLELLENLLDPSKRMEPQYVPFYAATSTGKTHTGLLVKRDATEVVLKDAQNQETRLKAAEVEQLSPGRQSLMPDGLLRDLTAQQAADLLEFLATRR
jgi:putative heme-binding domain-containing protein